MRAPTGGRRGGGGPWRPPTWTAVPYWADYSVNEQSQLKDAVRTFSLFLFSSILKLFCYLKNELVKNDLHVSNFFLGCLLRHGLDNSCR